MKKCILIVFLLTTILGFSQEIKLKGGNWTKKLKSSDITSAGGDYAQFYLSGTKQTKISISPGHKSHHNDKHMPFKVFVSREDMEWHSDLVIEAKLTSTEKHGNSSGTNFQVITNNSSLFFNTVGSEKELRVQYKISGLSVTIPAETYSTEIIYTVLNL